LFECCPTGGRTRQALSCTWRATLITLIESKESNLSPAQRDEKWFARDGYYFSLVTGCVPLCVSSIRQRGRHALE